MTVADLPTNETGRPEGLQESPDSPEIASLMKHFRYLAVCHIGSDVSCYDVSQFSEIDDRFASIRIAIERPD